jgi:hypothetical protein
MGYYMDLEDHAFTVNFDQKAKALAEVKDFTRKMEYGYRWVTKTAVLNSDTLEEVFDCFGWDTFNDSNGNIVGLDYDGNKIGSEETLFGVLAPFIESESYIQMRGEDGTLWRWCFDGHEISEVTATVTW